MRTLFWFRRDRRIQDNLALNAAAEAASELHSLFVFPQWLPNRSPLRQHSILESARSLDASLPGGLSVTLGNSAEAISTYCKDHEIETVFATRSFDTSGIAVQEEVHEELALLGVELALVDSYYAVTPGTIRKDDGSPLKVYTPFYKRWYLNGWDSPAHLDTASVNWAPAKKSQWFEPTGTAPLLVKAGEARALATLERFRERVDRYHEDRNRCDISGTSHLSHALAHGEIHPRTLLAELGSSEGEEVFRKEIA